MSLSMKKCPMVMLINPYRIVRGARIHNMGTVHRSDHSCAIIIRHIAQVMQKKLCAKLLKFDHKVSLMLDEATLFGSAAVALPTRLFGL